MVNFIQKIIENISFAQLHVRTCSALNSVLLNNIKIEQGIQRNVYCDEADSLQYIFSNIIIFKLTNIYMQFGGTD